MTTAAGSGHVERIGRAWYLRRRESFIDSATGQSRQRQYRVKLGTTREIRSGAAARKVADGWLARLAAPTLEPGIATTFREYSERFIRDHVARLRPSSARRYTSCIRILQESIGHEALSVIDTPRLQSCITEVSEKRAPATVKTLRAVALQVLRQARTDKFAAHVIETREIKLPRPSKPAKERPSFTRDELERIIAASYPPWSVLFGLMGYTGMRVGEACALTWSDVDLEARTLKIRGNVTRAGIGAPKTPGSAATLPMLDRVHELLSAYRPVWRQNPAGLLFAGRTGRPLIADDVRTRKLQPLLKRLGLPAAGIHSFRHSTPAILAGMGLTFEAVQRYMRHSSAAQTSKYLHFSGEQLREAIDAARARTASVQTSATRTGP